MGRKRQIGDIKEQKADEGHEMDVLSQPFMTGVELGEKREEDVGNRHPAPKGTCLSGMRMQVRPDIGSEELCQGQDNGDESQIGILVDVTSPRESSSTLMPDRNQ